METCEKLRLQESCSSLITKNRQDTKRNGEELKKLSCFGRFQKCNKELFAVYVRGQGNQYCNWGEQGHYFLFMKIYDMSHLDT